MGLYLEAPSRTGKADWLIANAEAVEIQEPTTHNAIPGHSVVCVVNNPGMGFDAAGLAVDDYEVERFKSGLDGRPARWLAVPRAQVERLCPQAAGVGR